MTISISSREAYFWRWALAVVATIFVTLFTGQPLAELLDNQNVRAAIFLLVMGLIGAMMVVHALKTRPRRGEIAVWLGVTAVYVMFFLRLGMPERSHLMEYSVLAVFVHKAIDERLGAGRRRPVSALLAFLLTFLVGVVDETIQLFLPDRVFDPADMFFNGSAAALALGAAALLDWVRGKRSKE
ncbi:VanZ family protein [Lewinella aquimaris]|uniref:VanZ family protein n=1 Tax=Neolewinella aquimaris TaxID=1835722 RepID=A0A840E9G4_9BACT|nr:VanZ family protein [Neolewinella aquimaris]MBB4080362.1 VanZ family protein [Neolewinella aquimaris]